MMKSHRTQAGMVGLFLLLLTAGLCLVTCEEAPFEPNGDDVPPEPKDYRVWFWDGSSDREFFAYHTKTGLVDTLVMPNIFPWFGFTVSSDGSKFYVAESVSTKIVDISSGEVLYELPYKANGGLVASPDGRWLAVHGQPGFWVLSLEDWSVVYHDSLLTYADSWFTLDGKCLYTSGKRDSGYSILTVDVDGDFQSVETAFPGTTIQRMRPSVDGATWYYLGGTSTTRHFAVYDVAKDSVTYRYWLWPGYGDMEITPDGRYIFLSEPGSYQYGSGPSNFTVFSTAPNRVDRLINTAGVADGFNPVSMPIGEMVVTPDSEFMVGGEGIGGSSLIRFNIDAMTIDDYVDLPGNGLGSFTCQLK